MGFIKVVSLDFDDTLIRSEAVKRRVLVEVAGTVDGGAEALRKVKTDARASKGVTRYTIFRDLGKVVGHADPEALSRELGEEYSRRVGKALEEAEEVDGATALLKELRARGIPTYVNSATPQRALEAAVQGRGWTRYFRGILGSPDTGGDKVDNLKTMGAPDEIVHVGDGQNDADAAKRFGCAFIGVHLTTETALAVVDDMTGAIAVIRAHLADQCRICDKNFATTIPWGGAIWRSDRWLLCHASPPAPVAGWCMLHTIRRVPSPADFNDDEALEFGPVLRHIQAALLDATNAIRIYACAMAETSAHFHMHLVPRLSNLPTEFTGFNLFRLQALAKSSATPSDLSGIALPSDDDVLRVVNHLRSALRDRPPPTK